MTLIFSGNDYKYELESIVKLFFPAQLFTILYDERNADGDLCFMRKKTGRTKTYLYAFVRLDDKTAKLSSSVMNTEEKLDKKCELELARLLFLCLKKLTGITPGWGLITGVRPVKRVNQMFENGYIEEQIAQELKQGYLVSREKINLAILTAKTQNVILRNLKADSFSLYVSIPFCPSRCSYCSFVSQSIDRVKKIIEQNAHPVR